MLLSISNLTFGWLTDQPLFEDVSCSLAESQVVQLKGENGAGKTTFMQLISGMIPHFSRSMLLSGDIRLHDLTVFTNPPQQFFPLVGFIPGRYIDFFLLNENLHQEILLIRSLLNFPEQFVRDKIQEFTAFFPGINQIQNLTFNKMTPQQKVYALLFIYFLQGARLYLIDEALHALSADHKCFSFFHYLQQQRCSVIYVSHQTENAPFPVWEIKNKKIVC